jgi:hypothetical protein
MYHENTNEREPHVQAGGSEPYRHECNNRQSDDSRDRDGPDLGLRDDEAERRRIEVRPRTDRTLGRAWISQLLLEPMICAPDGEILNDRPVLRKYRSRRSRGWCVVFG